MGECYSKEKPYSSRLSNIAQAVSLHETGDCSQRIRLSRTLGQRFPIPSAKSSITADLSAKLLRAKSAASIVKLCGIIKMSAPFLHLCGFRELIWD